MRKTKYVVHFIQNDYAGGDRVGKYANALETAASKEDAIQQASTRAHFGDAFLVQARYAFCIQKAKAEMVKKYGHHKGIA